MTEAEWLASTDTSDVLMECRSEAPPRKLRLFACACCRRVSTLLTEVELQVLGMAERYADNDGVSKGQLKNANRRIRTFDYALYSTRWETATAVKHAASIVADAPHGSYSRGDEFSAARHAAFSLLPQDVGRGYAQFHAHPVYVEEQRNQSELVRDIFGNPFRPVAFDSQWRSETAVSLAASIYEEKAFDRIPILADALEETGCDNADVLNHCRGAGPHVRGCWVVDQVLGKK